MFTFNKLLIMLSVICSCSPTIIASDAGSKSIFEQSNDQKQQPTGSEIPLETSLSLHKSYYETFLQTFPFKSDKTIKFKSGSYTYLKNIPLYIDELTVDDNIESGQDAILIHLSNEIYSRMKEDENICKPMAVLFDSNPSLVKSLIHICTEKKCPSILISSASTAIFNTYSNNTIFTACIDYQLSAVASFLAKQYIALQYINEAKQMTSKKDDHTFDIDNVEEISNSQEPSECLQEFFKVEDAMYGQLPFFIALRKKNHEKRLSILNKGKKDPKSLALTALLKYHGSTVFTTQAQEEEIKITQVPKEPSYAQHLNSKGTKISGIFFGSPVVASAMTVFLLILLTKGSEISPEIKLLRPYVLTFAIASSLLVVGVEGSIFTYKIVSSLFNI